MRYIHPFPARMAPEIALKKIRSLNGGQVILDPMSGSGMVLSQAVRNGCSAIGFDLDPLARLVSRVCSTKIDNKKAIVALDKLLLACQDDYQNSRNKTLHWIDNNAETKAFIDFWYAPLQINQLRLLSYYLVANPIIRNASINNVLKIALSRLIISKDPKASLARDTAHSRPHRTIKTNDFNIFNELPKSLRHVLSALNSEEIKKNSKTYLGDARKMRRIEDDSIDAIITSPPYLNAIDYMRGHRLSLVWFGYSIEKLRSIRKKSIGSEAALQKRNKKSFEKLFARLGLGNLDSKNKNMLLRYYKDLRMQMKESFRVLKPGCSATYVIGNSTIKGNYVQNSELLKSAGKKAGFEIITEAVREIPDNRRYMPISVKEGNSLAKRMRTEHVIEFMKCSS